MFKGAICTLVFFSQLNGSLNEPTIVRSEPFTKSSDVILNEITHATKFDVLLPCNHGYKFEIKEPYPFVVGQSISRIRLHFFNKVEQKYIFGIEEHKATGYKINFGFNVRGQKVNVNGSEGRFEPWANDTPGGYLRFVQGDTFIEIDSADLSKQMMINLAKSMKCTS